MKTNFFFAILLFVISSCSKNDEVPATIEVLHASPATARVNSTIKVIGKGFNNLLGADSSSQFKLLIGDVRCDVAVINDTLLEVFIPPNATGGPVCVLWKGE